MAPAPHTTPLTRPATRPTSPPLGPSGAIPVAVVALTALAGVVAAGILGGIFVQQIAGFRDGGALPRIGLPIVRTLHDAFGALTIGLLLLAGTMIPETTTTARRATATRIAAMTGTVWSLAGLATLLFQISNVSGVALSDPGFFAQVSSVVWAFDFFRVVFISWLVVVGVTVGTTVVRTRTSITWMAALSIGALLPLALAGHTAGAVAHDTAVNSLAVHIAAALTWTGCIAALVILGPVLGTSAPVVIKRFSVLAGWCYAGLVISGVLNASLRIGTPASLASTYGAILVAKVVLVVGLGVAGWRMRAAILPRLLAQVPTGSRSRPSAYPASGADVEEAALPRRAFAQLALLESALLGLATGLAVALSKTAPPVAQTESADMVTALTGYPAPDGPLTGWGWFTVFRIDWLWMTVALLGIGLYVAAVIRLRRRGDTWPLLTRMLPWIAGWLIFVWATSGAPGVYGRLQFSVHMLMHMTLTMAIPLCLALGAPLSLAARALHARTDKTLGPREIMLATAHSRYLSFWANPIIAAINFFGSLIVFYFTGLFELALRTHTGHVAMVVHFMLAGYMFCWILIGEDPGPKRWAPSLRLVLLFATMSFHAFFGVALLSGTAILGADFFRALSLPWLQGDAALLADQVDGGAITWGIGEAPMLALALMVGLVWMRQDEHEAKRADRQAERDHDAELTAYNEDLARRARSYRNS